MIDNTNILEMKKALPFWKHLKEDERELLSKNSSKVCFQKEESIHRNEEKCAGMIIVLSGQIRAFILSEDGRDITLYRLRNGEVCILSASCVLDAVAFDVFIEAVEETQAILIPLNVFHKLMEENVYVELFTYKLSTERFSDVMWTMQQILFMRADQRLAVFLWDELTRTTQKELCYTHEQIAKYIGSAREVVTRMLKYFQKEGIVELARGKILIKDRNKLKRYL